MNRLGRLLLVIAASAMALGVSLAAYAIEQNYQCSTNMYCLPPVPAQLANDGRAGIALILVGAAGILFILAFRTSREQVTQFDSDNPFRERRVPEPSRTTTVRLVERAIDSQNSAHAALSSRAAVILGFLSLLLGVTFTSVFVAPAVQPGWGVFALTVFIVSASALVGVLVGPDGRADSGAKALDQDGLITEAKREEAVLAAELREGARDRESYFRLRALFNLGVGTWLAGLILLALAWVAR
jgi:FtsH-binding integral membrane protein